MPWNSDADLDCPCGAKRKPFDCQNDRLTRPMTRRCGSGEENWWESAWAAQHAVAGDWVGHEIEVGVGTGGPGAGEGFASRRLLVADDDLLKEDAGGWGDVGIGAGGGAAVEEGTIAGVAIVWPQLVVPVIESSGGICLSCDHRRRPMNVPPWIARQASMLRKPTEQAWCVAAQRRSGLPLDQAPGAGQTLSP